MSFRDHWKNGLHNSSAEFRKENLFLQTSASQTVDCIDSPYMKIICEILLKIQIPWAYHGIMKSEFLRIGPQDPEMILDSYALFLCTNI